jgi:hypothetical protein
MTREPDPCALGGGTNETIEMCRSVGSRSPAPVIEPSGLGERHTYDVWAKRDERQCVWG